MTSFLEKLIELLREWWGRLVPWAILGDDQVGLVRRLGVTRQTMRRGWNWKCPIIEETLACSAAIDSYALREQSLTTSDGKQVTLRGVITYQVVDPYKWIVQVNDPESVLNDAGCIAIAELVPQHTSAEVLTGNDFLATLTRRVRARAKRFGIDVDSVGLADRTQATTFRLMGDR